MREPSHAIEQSLQACLRDEYAIIAGALEFLALGLDTNAWVYRAVNEDGVAYLVKARVGGIYEPSVAVPRYLNDLGIGAVVAPLHTRQGALWTHLSHEEHASLSVTVYPFIAGVAGWNPPMTDAQWEVAGAALKRVHAVPPPGASVPSLRAERFDPTEYARWVRAFEANEPPPGTWSAPALELRAHWMENRATIDRLVTAMEALASLLRAAGGPYVICHADLHPSNMIRDDVGGVYIVDWDDVMLAPKERDFIFVADPPADVATHADLPAFFQGYGAVEIDWVALTYYRCERVVTDVIEFTREAVFRDDLSEAAKASSARIFSRMFSPDGMLGKTWAAASRLPPHLRTLLVP